MDTDGSTPGEVVMVPMPRIKISRFLFDAPVRKSTVGTSALMSWRLLRSCAAACAAVTTVSATGPSCSGSSRRRAETVISCSCVLLSDASDSLATGSENPAEGHSARLAVIISTADTATADMAALAVESCAFLDSTLRS